MKISVIIPVYNTEKYLKECVESVLAQTYYNLEILLINDGQQIQARRFANHMPSKMQELN